VWTPAAGVKLNAPVAASVVGAQVVAGNAAPADWMI
jgi:hypothetical protein